MMEYSAHIRKEEDGFVVSFPDFPNINTYGKSMDEALSHAKEALNGTLETEFERGYRLPAARKFQGKRFHYQVPVLPHIELAYALKNIRNDHTQSDIAKKLGISYQAYQKLENPRKCNPTVKTLEKISEVMGKSLEIAFRDTRRSHGIRPSGKPRNRRKTVT